VSDASDTKGSGPSRTEANRKRREAIDRRVAELTEEAGGDLAKAERSAAGTIVLGRVTPWVAIGLVMVFVAIFLPHSGKVFGYDVLLFSQRAEDYVTTMPERIYAWLALVGGVLLPLGTLLSRSSLVAWVNWAVSAVGAFYCVLAIGFRNSRPPTEPGSGPSIGLFIGGIGLLVIVLALSSRLFRRSAVQSAINVLRRETVHRDEDTRAAQQVLRTGLQPHDEEVVVDDRRAKARARRERRNSEDNGVDIGEDQAS
jgi:hypothetical protein